MVHAASAVADLPELAHEQVLFRQVQVPRAGWIGLWEAERARRRLAAVQVFSGARAGVENAG